MVGAVYSVITQFYELIKSTSVSKEQESQILRNSKTKMAFCERAANHQEVISRSQIMQKKTIQIERCGEIEALTCTHPALALTGEFFRSALVSWRLSSLFKKIESRQFEKITTEEISKNIYFITHYLDLGIISFEDVVSMLSIVNSDGTVLHSVMALPQTLLLLERFIPGHFDLLTQLLSLQDQNGGTVFWLPQSLKPLIPLLEKYFPDHIDELINVFFVKNTNGETLLFLENMIEEILPILQRFIPHHMKSLTKLIGTQNKQGLTILFFDDVIKEMLPILDQFFPDYTENLTQLLALQNQEGWTVLSNPNYFLSLLPLLARYNPNHIDQLIRILSVQNKYGQTILHYSLAFEQIFPPLEKLFAGKRGVLLQILGIKNSQGDICLKNSRIFDLCRIQLAKLFFLFPDEFMSLLILQNNCGETILHDNLLFQKFYGFFNNYVDERFAALVSIPNHLGDTPLHSLANFQMVQSRINSSGMTQLLELKNEEGMTVEDVSKFSLNDSWMTSKKCFEDKFALHTKTDDDQHIVELHTLIKNSAVVALKALIEKTVRFQFDGNLHVMNQFLYALGLSRMPDALSNMTVEQARQHIHLHWSLPGFYRECLSSGAVESVKSLKYLDPHLQRPVDILLYILHTLGCIDDNSQKM